MKPELEIIDEFTAIDIDRLYIDTEKFSRIFSRVAMDYFDIDADKIKRVQQIAENAGETFDLYKHLRDLSGVRKEDSKWRRFEESVRVAARREDIRMPGAIELLDAYKSAHRFYGFMTYVTGDSNYQILKMESGDIDQSSEMVWMLRQEDKARLLGSLYVLNDQGGYFQLPPEFHSIRARSLLQLDDKAKNLNHTRLDLPIRGYHVLDRAKPVLPLQVGPLPPNARRVDTLFDVLSAEF